MPITVEDASKDILVEAPIVGDIENVLVDNKNDSNALQKPSLPVTTLSNEDESIRQSEPSEPAIEATKLSANKTNSDSDNSTTVEKDELNLTEENQIPVFSEWAQKRLEEVEKEVEQEAVNTSTMKKNAPAANKQPVLKLKNLKNYASPDCGAKIIGNVCAKDINFLIFGISKHNEMTVSFFMKFYSGKLRIVRHWICAYIDQRRIFAKSMQKSNLVRCRTV